MPKYIRSVHLIYSHDIIKMVFPPKGVTEIISKFNQEINDYIIRYAYKDPKLEDIIEISTNSDNSKKLLARISYNTNIFCNTNNNDVIEFS